jgi:hypothetical protein
MFIGYERRDSLFDPNKTTSRFLKDDVVEVNELKPLGFPQAHTLCLTIQEFSKETTDIPKGQIICKRPVKAAC